MISRVNSSPLIQSDGESEWTLGRVDDGLEQYKYRAQVCTEKDTYETMGFQDVYMTFPSGIMLISLLYGCGYGVL